MSSNHPARGCNCATHVRRRIRDRTSPKHRARRRAYQSEYYHKNAERMYEKAKQWKAENPERYRGLMMRFKRRRRIRAHDEQFDRNI